MHVFCAVLAWSRVRFVRFADNETRRHHAGAAGRVLRGCSAGCPKIVLADRMGCLKAGVVANVVVPTADYVRFATHYGFRPDFCHAKDPESKGIVENLVGYAKRDLMIPDAADPRRPAGGERRGGGVVRRGQRRGALGDLRGPGRRLSRNGPLLGVLPSLRREIGPQPISRKVDKLSCVRFGSARYSVPNRLIGTQSS